eukprot:TRINITY_DN4998_c0_g1_i2.p1 TRINITY_DN4998_c0_g1~~TRINITY_DN4998_c0_g1_i2.p1  ORF type:complete len:559 (+),score=77.04 TRINITY_DN4998_c0_g1_i2:66-1742(+)
MDSQTSVAGDHGGASITRSPLLFPYVLSVSLLAFIGRGVHFAFLPLVLKTQFDQTGVAIGVVMSVYPFVALVSTPLVAKFCRESVRIVMVNSFALIFVAAAMMLTSLAEPIQSLVGTAAAVIWIFACRAFQGAGAALYLSSNTSLLARRFPDQLPYVIGMTEVAVGAGGQLGRLVGGFLFDFFGFCGPFLIVGIVQTVVGIFGTTLEDAPASTGEVTDSSGRGVGKADNAERTRPASIPWSQLITARILLGGMGAFMMYFVGCFGDATLLQYLFVHLAPVSVGELNVIMCVRGGTYLVCSLAIAQVMHGQLISYERLMLVGALVLTLSQLLIAPQPFFMSAAEQIFPEAIHSWGGLVSVQIFSFVLGSIGNALIFVPGLPLMQSEARCHGNQAIEKVAELFVALLTLGEMAGPLFGGWLVGKVGFVTGTLVLAITCLPLAILAFAKYDSKVVSARWLASRTDLGTSVLGSDGAGDAAFPGFECGPRCKGYTLSDGEASFAWRRIPFVLDVKRAIETESLSAPSSVFRRAYKEDASARRSKGYMSAPSDTFRRPYQASG